MRRTPRRWWLRRGLRARVILLATAVTLVVLVGLSLLAARLLGPLLVGSVDEELSGVLSAATREVRTGQPVDGNDRVRVRVLDTSGAAVDGAGPAALERNQVSRLKAGLFVTDEAAAGGGPDMRWVGDVVTAPDGAQRLVVVGSPLTGFAVATADASRWLLVVALVCGVVAGLAIWLGVRSVLEPVARMRRTVRRLPVGHRLPSQDAAGELRALATEFNALLERQESSARQMRRFTDDAAHELRSPVTSIRAQAEVAVANPDAELAQETLQDVLDEVERLSTLLDGLLALARADSRELPQAEPVELVTEVRAAADRLPAESPPVRLNPAAARAWALCTHAEVELVADNLLRNACAHAAGEVVVSVLVSGGYARLVVDDDGPGVAAEHRDHVFDRFYRSSADRARTSGGAGLGLAMVAEAVRRRGGGVSVGESPEGGARFRTSWPAAR